MNVRSLLRSLRKKLFGAAAPRHKPFRHKPDLTFDHLEQRDLFSVSPPTILSVTPVDYTNVGATPPQIKITFSEAMDAADATNAYNYLLYNTAGTQITNFSLAYANDVATLTFNGSLPAGAYTLFLRGDQVHEATDFYTLSQPGQLVVANMGISSQATPPQLGPSTVSTIGVADNGTLNTVTSYPLGQSYGNQGFSPFAFPSPLLITVADFNGDGINDVAVVNNLISA